MQLASNTLSRVYKLGTSQVEVSPLSLRPTGEQGGVGVHDFVYPQMDPAAVAEQTEAETPGQGPEPESSHSEQPAMPVEIDIEDIRKEAFQEGYAEGESAGARQAEARLRETIESFGNAVRSLTEYKPSLRQATQRELVKLALGVAQRILHREVTVDPAVVLGIVRTCLDEFNASDMNRLGVHPRDYDVVTGYFEDNPLPNLEVVSDPTVGLGGAVFETSHGKIDARLDTQLKEIEQGLADG